MSDGENNGSLAGLRHRASRFPLGSLRPEPGGWDADGGAAVCPSRSRRPLIQAMAASPAPVIGGVGPVIRANVSDLGSHLACRLYPEDWYPALDQPFARSDGNGLGAMLAVAPGQPPGSVDGILAWDVFD